MNTEQTEKVCSRCKILKPISSFYKRTKEGHLRTSHCIDCQKNILRDYKRSLKGKIKIREIFKARYQDKTDEYINKSKKRNKEKPEAVWASGQARYALKKGLIQKKPCENCGSLKSEMHHRDYLKPLDVTWLCRSCHMTEHYHQKGACRNGSRSSIETC